MSLVNEHPHENGNLVRLSIVGFFMCFVSAAIVTQFYSGISPTLDYSPYDYFTGGALWMASSVCLILAASYKNSLFKMLFWLAGCATLSILAIDEFMGMHEATQDMVGDDDHIKVFIWAAAAIGLYTIWRVEQAGRSIAKIFVLGFIFHTTYLVVDIGDGDYFSLPFALNTLQWTEDTCELFFVSTYLSALMLLLISRFESLGTPRQH